MKGCWSLRVWSFSWDVLEGKLNCLEHVCWSTLGNVNWTVKGLVGNELRIIWSGSQRVVNFIITTSAEVRAVLSQGHRGLVGVTSSHEFQFWEILVGGSHGLLDSGGGGSPRWRCTENSRHTDREPGSRSVKTYKWINRFGCVTENFTT